MRREERVCDACGRVRVDNDKRWLSILIVKPNPQLGEGAHIPIDLCDACGKDLMNVIARIERHEPIPRACRAGTISKDWIA